MNTVLEGMSVEISVKCTHCKTLQNVHIAACTSGRYGTSPQTIKCLKCTKLFETPIREEIIGGPFLILA
jgi:phage FluMu protein Com